MPRKGNPQHNARKRVARERHEAEHAAGFLQCKKSEVEHFRRVAVKNEETARVILAALMRD